MRHTFLFGVTQAISSVSVTGLFYATIRQRVSRVIWIRAIVHHVGRMRQGELRMKNITKIIVETDKKNPGKRYQFHNISDVDTNIHCKLS